MVSGWPLGPVKVAMPFTRVAAGAATTCLVTASRKFGVKLRVAPAAIVTGFESVIWFVFVSMAVIVVLAGMPTPDTLMPKASASGFCTVTMLFVTVGEATWLMLPPLLWM